MDENGARLAMTQELPGIGEIGPEADVARLIVELAPDGSNDPLFGILRAIGQDQYPNTRPAIPPKALIPAIPQAS